MSLGTVLLIALAVAVMLLMYRVGRNSRGAAHAHSGVHDATVPFSGQGGSGSSGGVRGPEESRQADPSSHPDQDHEASGRRGHGCC